MYEGSAGYGARIETGKTGKTVFDIYDEWKAMRLSRELCGKLNDNDIDRVSFQVKGRADFMELAVYVPIKEAGSKGRDSEGVGWAVGG